MGLKIQMLSKYCGKCGQLTQKAMHSMTFLTN